MNQKWLLPHWWATLVSLCFMFGGSLSAQAQTAPQVPPEETFTFDVQVFLIPNAAQGTLRVLRVSKNRYRAELMAETKGIIGLFTLYKKNHYISEFEYVPEKRRYFNHHYTKLVYRGPDIERTTIAIDHDKGKVKWQFYSNDVFEDGGTEPIPEGIVYEDLLSIFFNFRNGVFGPLERGRKMTVYTLPDFLTKKKNPNNSEKKPYQKYEIRIVDAKKEAAYRKRYGRTEEKGLLALVKVPKDIFGQETGEVRIWFDEKIVPLAATVEDAILFGDVNCVLRKFKVDR
jgi:hypothetical protein